jgi:hypothetical protein
MTTLSLQRNFGAYEHWRYHDFRAIYFDEIGIPSICADQPVTFVLYRTAGDLVSNRPHDLNPRKSKSRSTWFSEQGSSPSIPSRHQLSVVPTAHHVCIVINLT